MNKTELKRQIKLYGALSTAVAVAYNSAPLPAKVCAFVLQVVAKKMVEMVIDAILDDKQNDSTDHRTAEEKYPSFKRYDVQQQVDETMARANLKSKL